MVNECCTNELCVNRETQLRLARLREELLTNFNSLLIDRIRFLEQTITRLSLISLPATIKSSPPFIDKHLSSEILITDRLAVPSSLRRSTSATAYLLQSSDDSKVTRTGAKGLSSPSSVDLSNNNDEQEWFLSIKAPLRIENRASFESKSTYLSTPITHRQWARSTNDLPSSTIVNSEKGRLESRRFACDVNDNDVRAFKAMVYTEQARKQHARPLNRLRQALGISSNSSAGNYASCNVKKHTNF